MPIYEYLCSRCNRKVERILRINDCEIPQECECGERLMKLVSLPMPAIFIVTNRDNLVKSLNDEGGYKLPGGKKHSKRYKSIIGDSLTREKPTIGRGF